MMFSRLKEIESQTMNPGILEGLSPSLSIQLKLVELLLIVAGDDSMKQFKESLSQFLDHFKHSQCISIAAYSQKKKKFRLAPLEEKVTGFPGLENGTQTIENDLRELLSPDAIPDHLIVSNRGHDRRYQWISGDFVIIPAGTKKKLLGCLVIGLKKELMQEALTELKYFQTIAYPICSWLHRSVDLFHESSSFEMLMAEQGFSLNSKEQRILELLVAGEPNKEIGNIVHLSEQGVKYHVGNLFGKFNVKCRSELRTKILKMGF